MMKYPIADAIILGTVPYSVWMEANRSGWKQMEADGTPASRKKV
jgi:hypothetical protein